MKKKNKNVIDIDILLEKVVNLKYEEFIETIIEKKVKVDSVNSNGETLLHLCVKNGFIEKFYVLLNMNVDVNKKNKLGENILHYGSKYCNDEYLVQEIAKKYINPLDRDNEGNSAIHYCDNERLISYYYNWSKLNRVDLKEIKNKLGENIFDYVSRNKYKNENFWLELK